MRVERPHLTNYSAAEDLQIVERARAGATLQVIAGELGRSISSVQGRLRKLLDGHPSTLHGGPPGSRTDRSGSALDTSPPKWRKPDGTLVMVPSWSYGCRLVWEEHWREKGIR